jgi:hypothetical protein
VFKFPECLIVIHTFLSSRVPGSSSDRVGCNGAITSEALRRINWTMVLAIPWYGGAVKIKYAPL